MISWTNLGRARFTVLLGLWLCSPALARERSLPGARVARGRFLERLTFSGDLEAATSITISSPRISSQWNFRITYMADEGTLVSPGDLVLEFDTSELLLRKLDLEKKREEARIKIARKEAQIDGRRQDALLQVAAAEKALQVAALYRDIDRALIPRADAEKYRFQYQTAELALKKAHEKLDNLASSSRAELEVERLGFQQADLNLKRTLSELGRLSIRAPAPGLVLYEENWTVGRRYQVGDQVYSGQRLIRLPNMKQVYVRTYVHDVDVASLERGMPAEIRLDAIPGRSFQGRVEEISRVAKPVRFRSSLKTFQARVRVLNPDLELMRPGMTARVEVVLARENQLMVPRAAIRFDAQGQSFVLRRGSPPEKVPVRVLDANTDRVSIQADLDPGEELLLAGHPVAGRGAGERDWITVKRRDLRFTVSATGILKAGQAVDIRPPAVSHMYQFKITRLVPEGKKVRRGDFLVSFDPTQVQKRLRDAEGSLQKVRERIEKTRASQQLQLRDLRLELEQARADRNKARNKLGQARQFSSTLKVKEAEYEARYQVRRVRLLESKVDSVERASGLELRILEGQEKFYGKRVQAYRKSLESLVLTAPIDGVVIYSTNWSNEKKRVGSQVYLMEPILALPDLRTLEVEAQVAEVDASRVHLGQKATVSLDAIPEKTFQGRVRHISRIFSRASPERPMKVLRIAVELDQIETARMRPGMAARLELQVDRFQNVLAVPLSVIRVEEGESYVWVRQGKRAVRRRVRLGRSNGVVAVVLEGLQEGDQVLGRPPRSGV